MASLRLPDAPTAKFLVSTLSSVFTAVRHLASLPTFISTSYGDHSFSFLSCSATDSLLQYLMLVRFQHAGLPPQTAVSLMKVNHMTQAFIWVWPDSAECFVFKGLLSDLFFNIFGKLPEEFRISFYMFAFKASYWLELIGRMALNNGVSFKLTSYNEFYLLCVCCFIAEVVTDHWTASFPLSAWGFLPGKGPPASVNLSLHCCSPPNEPSTLPGGPPGTTNTELSPKKPSSLVQKTFHNLHPLCACLLLISLLSPLTQKVMFHLTGS